MQAWSRALTALLWVSLGFGQTPFAERLEDQALRKLASVRRVYVEPLGGGKDALQIHDMVITELQESRGFVVTENKETADAFLRGSARDESYSETHNYSSSETSGQTSLFGNLGAAAGGAIRDRRGRFVSGGGRTGGSGSSGSSDGLSTVERKHEAVIALRLVDSSGDVIWSATEESDGGKFRGAGAEVAERIVRNLMAAKDRGRQLAVGTHP